MSRRTIFPLLLGFVGASILTSLGIWQVQRLAWKEEIMASMEARLSAPPVAISPSLDKSDDNYASVFVKGRLAGPELHVLTSRKPDGPGFRVIQGLETEDGRRILADLGFIPEAEKNQERLQQEILILGNLIWPDETDGFTPDPNIDRNIWFARDTERMSKALDTDPVMVALRSSEPELAPAPMPVTLSIPNDHLEYAITWFSLAVVWIGMTVFLLWRIKRVDAKDS